MTPAQMFFKLQHFPLDRFDYLWMAPHIRPRNDPKSNARVQKRWMWETKLPTMTVGRDEYDINAIKVYASFMEQGQLNPLIGHDVGGVVYLVDKGNTALAVLRAIRNVIRARVKTGTPLTPQEAVWRDRGFDAIPAKICCPCDDWSHDCPAARFHEWAKWL